MSKKNKKTKETIIENNDNAVKKFSIIMEHSSIDGIVFDYHIVLDYLNDLGEVSAILHDRDLQSDGSQKHKHIHIVINLNTKIRKNTLLNKLVMLGFPSNIFTIERVTNYTMMLRYLVHKDNKEKTQYTPMEVITNCENVFTTALNFESDDITAEKLLHIVLITKGNKYLIMRDLGLNLYIKYRNVISDILHLYFNGYFNDNNENKQMKGGI